MIRRNLVLGLVLALAPACGDDEDSSDPDPTGERDSGARDGGITVIRDAASSLDASGEDASRDIDATIIPDAARPNDAAATASPDATVDAAPGASDAASDAVSDAAADAAVYAPGSKEYSLAKLDPDMRTVIDALTGLGVQPVDTLTVEQARTQATIKDAVQKVLTEQGKSTEPEQVAKVEDRTIAILGNDALPIRVYTPSGEGPFSVIVYFHGGGWVIATNDTYDASARALANATGAVVVAVEYRKGPEFKFAAAHDDAFGAYRWVLDNAEEIDGRANSVAVAGESAGGNLAANVVLSARGQQVPLPVHALLVYPVTSTNLTAESYVEHANAVPLNAAAIPWFTDKYLNGDQDKADYRINLVSAELGGFSPTTIINAEVDPLLSDGLAFKDKLLAASVNVQQRTYQGVTHEFFGAGAAVADAKTALQFAAERIKSDFVAP
jgi:acetyl esterase